MENNMDTVILEKTMLDTEQPSFTVDLIKEAIDRIPYINRLKNPIVRKRLFEQCGNGAFIDPENLNYPIINPDDMEAMESVTPDCDLLLKAFYELKLDQDPRTEKLYEKAKEILQNSPCEREKICVHLEGLEEIVELDTLLFYFCDTERVNHVS